jgi:hypothetical protein
MGGQACILYGGAEFSRDADLAILADSPNLARLEAALNELQADRIAVPPFEKKYLDIGLAIHFRCSHPDAMRIRVDIMSRMRGVDDFPALWDRRTSVEFADQTIEVLSLPDLVCAKKTQRDKDWPMITRLVESNYFQHRERPSSEQIHFWFRESRTALHLIEIAAKYPEACEAAITDRPLLAFAKSRDAISLGIALQSEADAEKAADRAYWEPLKKELEKLREDARRDPG